MGKEECICKKACRDFTLIELLVVIALLRSLPDCCARSEQCPEQKRATSPASETSNSFPTAFSFILLDNDDCYPCFSVTAHQWAVNLYQFLPAVPQGLEMSVFDDVHKHLCQRHSGCHTMRPSPTSTPDCRNILHTGSTPAGFLPSRQRGKRLSPPSCLPSRAAGSRRRPSRSFSATPRAIFPPEPPTWGRKQQQRLVSAGFHFVELRFTTGTAIPKAQHRMGGRHVTNEVNAANRYYKIAGSEDTATKRHWMAYTKK